MKSIGCLHAVAIFCLFQSAIAGAAPPANVTPDPGLHAWFESLKKPGTGQPCCSISDCRFTSYDTRNGHYEITIDGWPYLVPDEAVLHTTNNPLGRAVVCYNYTSFGPPVPRGEVRTTPQDTIEILCFLPTNPLS